MTLSQGTDAVVTFLVSGRARPVSPTWLQSPALARAQRADGAGEGRLAAGLVAVILILRDVGFSLAELDDQIAKAQTVQEAIDHVLGCPCEGIFGCPLRRLSPPPASPVGRSARPTSTSYGGAITRPAHSGSDGLRRRWGWA